MSRLRIEQLGFQQLGPFSLQVEPGQCVTLSGPSGSGKTLLLRAVADLDPHTGRVALGEAEQQAVTAPEWRRLVMMLPAESQWWYDKVEPHFPARQSSRLQRLGFDDGVMQWDIGRLSTGERQRLGLLRLLAHEPQALLLDEPTAGLDPAAARAVESLVADYRRERRCPVLWVSHDEAQVNRVAERAYRLEAGELTEAPRS
ncbi:MAG: ATP-binding cassette domain-containing protein [Candidatus Eisenbacteria bacterium]|nr:ATP-binding cassette domain-containing protein [Candidatus Eisenbacteria bacterium]